MFVIILLFILELGFYCQGSLTIFKFAIAIPISYYICLFDELLLYEYHDRTYFAIVNLIAKLS